GRKFSENIVKLEKVDMLATLVFVFEGLAFVYSYSRDAAEEHSGLASTGIKQTTQTFY
ncbi:hypothetical protein SFRURICE_008184, partial [Spodoptera frugiperda]